MLPKLEMYTIKIIIYKIYQVDVGMFNINNKLYLNF